MEQSFVGLEVRVRLFDGRSLEGIIKNVAPEADLLLLEDACKTAIKRVNNFLGVGLISGSGSTESYPSLELPASEIEAIDILQDLSLAHFTPSIPSPSAINGSSYSPPHRESPKGNSKGTAPNAGKKVKGYDSNEATPRKGNNNRQSPNFPSEWCSDDVKQYKNKEFDFQANLTLFDKAKIFSEIQAQDCTRPEDRLVAHNLSQRKLRHDQNVLEKPRGSVEDDSDDVIVGAKALSLETAEQPQSSPKLTNHTVPCVTLQSIMEIEEQVQGSGLITFEHITENAGRSLCSFLLEELGIEKMSNGVLLIVLPTRLGCFSLCAGRHLLNRGITVSAFAANDRRQSKIHGSFANSLELFSWYGGRVLDRPKGGTSSSLLLTCIDPLEVAAVARSYATLCSLVPSKLERPLLNVRFGLAHDLVSGAEHAICDIGWPAFVAEEHLQLPPGRYSSIFGNAFYTTIRDQ